MYLKKNLVSLVVPFYNCEKYIARFLESVLNQSYKNIQFILINDGSVDNSEKIVLEYSSDLKNTLDDFLYLKKENGGAASAINMGLKFVEGEYFAWADCDDVLCEENIEKKIEFLMNDSSFGLVVCGAKAYNECTGELIGDLIIPSNKQKDNMFMQILDGIPCYAGVFMLRTELLFDKISNKEIFYHKEIGQNYQLLLPVAYDNKCGFIQNSLYEYHVRMDSHSRDVGYEDLFIRTYTTEMALEKILDFMPEEEKKDLLKKKHLEYTLERYNITFSYGDRERNNKFYSELKKEKCLNRKMMIKRIIISNVVLYKIYRSVRRIK